MVEKRTVISLALVMLVWAVSISSLAAYFYLENTTYSKQIAENKESLNETASSYDESMSRYNMLSGEYAALYLNYSDPSSTNFTLLTGLLGGVVENLKGNYSYLLMNQEDLNETYNDLLNRTIAAFERGNVSEGEFGNLLRESYELFDLLVIRELGGLVSETVTVTVNVCLDYGNGTVEWYNGTDLSAGSSLFQLTQEVAKVDPKYYSWAWPGHIYIEAINDKREFVSYYSEYCDGYSWTWYHWNKDEQKWVSGPVGCDAWMPKDGGVYKWNFEYWRFDYY